MTPSVDRRRYSHWAAELFAAWLLVGLCVVTTAMPAAAADDSPDKHQKAVDDLSKELREAKLNGADGSKISALESKLKEAREVLRGAQANAEARAKQGKQNLDRTGANPVSPSSPPPAKEPTLSRPKTDSSQPARPFEPTINNPLKGSQSSSGSGSGSAGPPPGPSNPPAASGTGYIPPAQDPESSAAPLGEKTRPVVQHPQERLENYQKLQQMQRDLQREINEKTIPDLTRQRDALNERRNQLPPEQPNPGPNASEEAKSAWAQGQSERRNAQNKISQAMIDVDTKLAEAETVARALPSDIERVQRRIDAAETFVRNNTPPEIRNPNQGQGFPARGGEKAGTYAGQNSESGARVQDGDVSSRINYRPSPGDANPQDPRSTAVPRDGDISSRTNYRPSPGDASPIDLNSGTRQVNPNEVPPVGQPGANGQDAPPKGGSTHDDFMRQMQENKGRPSGMTPEGLGMKSDANATLGGKEGVKASDLRGAANQGAAPGGGETTAGARPPAGGAPVAEGAATRGDYKPPRASSSAAEGERLGRAVSNATATHGENVKGGLSKLNDASTISKIANKTIDAVEGKTTGEQAAKDIAVTAIDYLTTPPVPGLPGAATTTLTLKEKTEDLARALNHVEKLQTNYDRQYAIEVGKALGKNVSPQDRVNIMLETARGNEKPLNDKKAELEQKGIKLELPEHQIAHVEADDTVLERTGNTLYGIGKGIVYDAPKEVLTQAWRTGDKLGTIARDGAAAVDTQGVADARGEEQKGLNEKMASHFEGLGFNRGDVEMAFNSMKDGLPYAMERLKAKAAILETCPDLQELPPDERQAALDALLSQMIAARPDVEQDTVVKDIAETLGPPAEEKPPITGPPPPENPPKNVDGGTDRGFAGTDAGGQGATDGQTPPPKKIQEDKLKSLTEAEQEENKSKSLTQDDLKKLRNEAARQQRIENELQSLTPEELKALRARAQAAAKPTSEEFGRRSAQLAALQTEKDRLDRQYRDLAKLLDNQLLSKEKREAYNRALAQYQREIAAWEAANPVCPKCGKRHPPDWVEK